MIRNLGLLCRTHGARLAEVSDRLLAAGALPLRDGEVCDQTSPACGDGESITRFGAGENSREWPSSAVLRRSASFHGLS
ncbi:MAG: hypothetical protein QG608_2334 [Actinomycetota bacterium]|nr:hypothetical protein [Actinomycetota bacterium]